jgi:hypothetical protein
MRHPAHLVAASAAALALILAPAAPAAEPVPTPLGVKVKTCATGADLPSRYAVFTGSMPRIAAATTLAMRFDLYAELPGQPERRVKGLATFGVWERSEPGVPGFVYDKRVDALAVPATYRVRVSFRWYDRTGVVLRKATRTSGACKQPDKRPDLQVAAIGFEPVPGVPALLRYAVTVRNAGRGPVVAPSSVALQVDAAVQPPRMLPPLAAGAAATVVFTAPACAPGSTVRALADAARGVVEVVEDDDAAVRACPVAAG